MTLRGRKHYFCADVRVIGNPLFFPLIPKKILSENLAEMGEDTSVLKRISWVEGRCSVCLIHGTFPVQILDSHHRAGF